MVPPKKKLVPLIIPSFLKSDSTLGWGQGHLVGPDPYNWGKMERGVKIGGSRGPKCRLDPLLGPFLVRESNEPLCIPFRACVPPCTRLVCPNVPAEAPTGHPKAPKRPYIGSKWDQSGVNIDSHCAKHFKMGQTPSKLAHTLQDGCPVGTNSPNLA